MGSVPLGALGRRGLLALALPLLIGWVAVAGETTTSLSSSPNPSVYGQEVTFVVMVSGVQTPSGTVTLKDGITTIGTKDLADEGSTTVMFTVSDLSVGTHTIIVEYSGYSDYGYEPSSDQLSHEVKLAYTTTTLTSDANPASDGGFGVEVTFTATVEAVPPGAGTPGGNVIFEIRDRDGNLVAGSWPAPGGVLVSMSGGTATYSVTLDAPGSPYTVVAKYSGDARFYPSESETLTQLVRAEAYISVSSSPNPSVTGQSVAFTAVVTAKNYVATFTPTGTVTFTLEDKDGVQIDSVTQNLDIWGDAIYITNELQASRSPYTLTVAVSYTHLTLPTKA